jgi:hypothetical protein
MFPGSGRLGRGAMSHVKYIFVSTLQLVCSPLVFMRTPGEAYILARQSPF